MDLEKAAGLLVVAWVKDWTILTLYSAINSSYGMPSDEEIEEFAKTYPFMTSNKTWYIRNKLIRTYISSLDRKLNDKFWDAKDNAERLKLVKYITHIKADHVIAKRKFTSDEYKDRRKITREAKAEYGSYKISREAFKKARGHDWKTVK
jgi:hypothetical protein